MSTTKSKDESGAGIEGASPGANASSLPGAFSSPGGPAREPSSSVTSPKPLSIVKALKREIRKGRLDAAQVAASLATWRARCRVSESALSFALCDLDNEREDGKTREAQLEELRAMLDRQDLTALRAENAQLVDLNAKLMGQVADLSAAAIIDRPAPVGDVGVRFELHRLLLQGSKPHGWWAKEIKRIRDLLGGEPS